jgi:glyoxylase-like metal-dependent hydrolase (beta-lactamase superfamily II)/rhodanese-related sulfurtransferase
MKVEQIYTGCLSQGAYYIESDGEAAIIDPLREVKPYKVKALEDDATIKYIFETHFHADFVSGHLTLAKETGADIVYGPTARPDFKAVIAEDGQEFKLGKVTIKALHTPGHTMESTTYLLRDEKGRDTAIFTGDTLFLGDVGRPDLAQKAADMTQDELAGLLYDSLRNKIMPLADDITVYPAHGAGSACGKNMMKETVDTLGNQKKVNYALREDMSREEFIKEVTEGLLPPPAYFPENVRMNKEGYQDIDQVLEQGTRPLSPDAFEAAANETGAVVLDVRKEGEFVKGHVPRSIFIGLDGQFAPWVGALISDVNQPILIVAPEGREEETVTRLSRVGFDHTLGYLQGGFEAWKEAGKQTDSIESISPDEFANRFKTADLDVYDVRKPGEYEDSHVKGAENTPLDFINEHLAELQSGEPAYIHCAGGYRSVIASSILKSRGIHELVNIEGGFGAIKKLDLPLETEVNEETQK